MQNWRPISLLNVDYKILTKVLATRLSSVLEFIVHPDQAAGVQNRSISDNLHLLRNIFDYVTERNIPCAWINIDFTKAYDKISHQFLFSCLHQFNFNTTFIRWVKILYRNVMSSVIVNNHISTPFPYSRGVRQGCSLSPLLFVLCLEPFANKVRKSECITGLQIPGRQEKVKNILFADDVTGVLTTDKGMKSFMLISSLYCRVSGSSLNFIKTNVT